MSAARERPLRIGAGASFADDRIAPAVELAERGELDYLAFECLAERTVARENQSRLKNPSLGYTPRLMDRMSQVLPVALRKGVKIITNMGAANPIAAVELVHEFARAQPVGPLHSAAVLGDDVTEQLRSQPGLPLLESGAPLEELLPRMVSANAYLGADVIVRALATGAQLVVTGRVANPSLYLAAAMHHYGWSYTDWTRLAAGTAAGHLLECCAQVSGGCFAAPGRKAVPDLGRLGFPYVDMQPDGSFVVSKLQDSGGRVDLATCKEQLIYEVHDPAAYITPDCVLDITGLEMRQEGENRVRIAGARARPRTDTYKVTVGYTDGYIGEGQISYAGIDAVARAEMAAAAVRQRLDDAGHRYGEMRVDLIGIDSLHARRALDADPYEVRLRIAARTTNRKAAEAVGFETRALHVNGPAGGAGGLDPVVREVLAVQSVLIPRGQVDPQVTIREFRT
ncbi:acyclic terpene utilization AtuA family protein [Bordetella parapertussis]|uniref:acyclic terpene utilization AtuA family protein n=1 Tax=Bordetella parapertussis TaxID=519 RepID=UPI0003022D0E|nr:acyclic terpene utilization AtuA family protein [Bordetella parapertussis]